MEMIQLGEGIEGTTKKKREFFISLSLALFVLQSHTHTHTLSNHANEIRPDEAVRND